MHLKILIKSNISNILNDILEASDSFSMLKVEKLPINLAHVDDLIRMK